MRRFLLTHLDHRVTRPVTPDMAMARERARREAEYKGVRITVNGAEVPPEAIDLRTARYSATGG